MGCVFLHKMDIRLIDWVEIIESEDRSRGATVFAANFPVHPAYWILF